MAMKYFYPPALQANDTIGIMAPSSIANKGHIEAATALLETRGFQVYVHPQTYKINNQSAGTAQEKTEALHELFRDPPIKAIIASGGGNRSGYMLEKLDYNLIRSNPKILMGYSDLTALLSAITYKTDLITFHGPVMNKLAKTMLPMQLEHCFEMLAGKNTSMPLNDATILHKGITTGHITGGNLSLICSLIGTPWQPDFKDSLLFLEDCGDETSRFDRMFLHLYNAGIFSQINGLVLGEFVDITDTGGTPFGFTLKDIIEEITCNTNIPVVLGAPFGHGNNLFTFPIGGLAELNTETEHINFMRATNG